MKAFCKLMPPAYYGVTRSRTFRALGLLSIYGGVFSCGGKNRNFVEGPISSPPGVSALQPNKGLPARPHLLIDKVESTAEKVTFALTVVNTPLGEGKLKYTCLDTCIEGVVLDEAGGKGTIELAKLKKDLTLVAMSAESDSGTKLTASLAIQKPLPSSSTAVPQCNKDGQKDCIANAAFRAADMSLLIPTNVRNGVTIAGQAGNSIATPLDCIANNVVGCVTTASFKSADLSNLNAGTIKNGVTVAGTAGQYPSVTYPLSGSSGTDLPSLDATVPAGPFQFFRSDGVRISGSISDAGTVAPTSATQIFSASLYRSFGVAGIANCSQDGQTGCVTTGRFKSGDTNAFTAWDLRAGITLAGVGGSLKQCRNLIDTTFYNVTPDKYSTVDNGNAPTTAVAGWNNYKCNETNWQDASSSGLACANGNGTGTDVCQPRDLFTGLIWSPIQSGSISWGGAKGTCDALTYGGVAAGTWRLPAQMELQQAYIDGIRYMASANFITSVNMNRLFHSSTTTSGSTNDARTVNIGIGEGANLGGSKGYTAALICVRP